MKKLFLSTLLLALPLLASAYDIAVENADGVAVNIPEEVTYMGRTRKVTSIESSAFRDCSGLTSVNIGNSVTSIGSSAFRDCSSLTSVNIGNSVTSIGERAFYECRGLTSVTIGNSVTSIGEGAFNCCSGLTSVHITDIAAWCRIAFNEPASNPLVYAHHLYMNGEEIKDLVIPNSVTAIGGSAFCNCTGLTSITIPNSVTNIGNDAFSGCIGLTSVTIPNSVTSIGDEAFDGCGSLTSVISKMENPCYIDDDCFNQDVFYNVTLYVPKGTVDKYRSTDYWNKFLFMEEGEPGSSTQPEEKKCATPTINYADKQLTFTCGTEGVDYHYTINDADIKSGSSSSVSLSATYEISVYVTKSGFVNSDVATATLVWTEAVFTETTPSTPSSAKAIRESIPMLISTQNGTITVRGEQDGLPLTVYTADGKMLGSATIKDGQASIATNLQRGQIAIVKVGKRSVKIKAPL